MAGIPGIMHIYHPKRTLPLFVYTPNNKSTSPTPNILLFIGGMWDALTATPYVTTLANYLSSSSSSSSSASPKWTVIHPLLSSSARQFGISSLDEDVEEIASAISYIRSTPALGTPASRIVLMGHSTGCQDVLHYITAPTAHNNRASRPLIQGAILQAPVSDRDSILNAIAKGAAERDAADECNRIAAATPAGEHSATLLPFHATRPFFRTVPVLISRWLSLASPSSPDQPADDDKFSFDLPPAVLARTFGQLAGPPLQPLPHPSSASLLVLMSGADECVAPGVDQAVLLARWKGVVDEASGSAELNPASGLVAGAKHNLAGDLFAQRWARQVDLPERVMTYLDEVVAGRSSDANGVAGRGVGKEAWELWRREKEALEREKEREDVAAAAAGLKL
ncbi:hypothetical protein DV737_g2461, partial [Chaetothyriales sp. CBS 132003]